MSIILTLASKPKANERRPTSIAASETFPTSTDGRLVIHDSDDQPAMFSTNGKQPTLSNGDADENYYLQALQSQERFTRGQRNRIKFSKRQRGDEDDDGEGVTMDLDEIDRVENRDSRTSTNAKGERKAKKRRSEKGEIPVPLGKEYKAKVSLMRTGLSGVIVLIWRHVS